MLKNRYFYEDNNCASGFMVDLAMGYWGWRKCAFFDIRVFHPNAQSYHNTSIPSVYRRHEQQKKREYGDRVREVELASFTPLVFSTTGGMGKEAVTFYRRLAELLSHDLQQHSCVVSLFVVQAFLFEDLQLYASGEAVPSLTDHLMLPRSWAL